MFFCLACSKLIDSNLVWGGWREGRDLVECQEKKKKKGPSFLPCCFFYRAAKTHNLLAQTVPQGSFRVFLFFVEFSNFEPLFGLKSAMPVRIDWRIGCRYIPLSCAALWEQAVIKKVCVALHMEFLIVPSCGARWRQRGRGEVFYTPTPPALYIYTACMSLLPCRKSAPFNRGGGFVRGIWLMSSAAYRKKCLSFINAQTQNDIVYSWSRCIYVSKESWHRVSWPLTRLVIIFLLLFGSAGTGRKSTWAMTTRWPWLSTPGTRVREGRTRPSCMWCSLPKLTTAVFTAIMRWLEMRLKPHNSWRLIHD